MPLELLVLVVFSFSSVHVQRSENSPLYVSPCCIPLWFLFCLCFGRGKLAYARAEVKKSGRGTFHFRREKGRCTFQA